MTLRLLQDLEERKDKQKKKKDKSKKVRGFKNLRSKIVIRQLYTVGTKLPERKPGALQSISGHFSKRVSQVCFGYS